MPRYRQRIYALAIYTGMRASELRRLMAEDVYLGQGEGLIRVRGTKTAKARRMVAIEPALRPLLEIMVERAIPGRALVRLPPEEDCAELVRKDLRTAGCNRAELYTDNAEHQHFTFHGLRHTAITHWCVAGKDISWIMSVAGHEDVVTMRGYLDRAAVIRASFGTPHPPLPDKGDKGWFKDRADEKVNVIPYLLRPQRELNPVDVPILWSSL